MTYEEDYQKIRDLLSELHMKIMKQLSRDDMQTTARHLGLLHKKTFVFNNEAEISVLSDYQVYSYRPHGISMVERYLRAKRKSLDPFTLELLEAMSRARFSIYVTGKAQKGKGLVVTDTFRQDSLFLADRSLSASCEPERAFALRLIVFDDFAIQTGAGIPLDFDLFEHEAVEDGLNKCLPDPVDEKYNFTPEQESQLARTIMAGCIRHGYTEHIRYS
jgi:hypothetical protein